MINVVEFMSQRDIISKGAEFVNIIIENATGEELNAVLSRAEICYQPGDMDAFATSVFVKNIDAVLLKHGVDMRKDYERVDRNALYARLHFLLTACHVEIKAHERMVRELSKFELQMAAASKAIEKKRAKGN